MKLPKNKILRGAIRENLRLSKSLIYGYPKTKTSYLEGKIPKRKLKNRRVAIYAPI